MKYLTSFDRTHLHVHQGSRQRVFTLPRQQGRVSRRVPPFPMVLAIFNFAYKGEGTSSQRRLVVSAKNKASRRPAEQDSVLITSSNKNHAEAEGTLRTAKR